MTAIDLIAAALPPQTPLETPQPGVCCVTGAECDTIARKHAIKSTFTNLDLLAAPLSDRIGVAAWRVMTHQTPPAKGKKRGGFPLMQSSWLCDGQSLRLLSRQDVRALVLNGVTAPQWSGYVTTSYKKHGALRCPVNTGSRQVWLFEMLRVDCSDRIVVAEMWRRLRAAQDAGIPRPLIETLEVSPGHMGKIGWRVWSDFEAWARPRMRSALYQFMTYLLPSVDELKKCSI